MTRRFDAIIIGTGQAGPPLAARLSKAGMRVAIIERDKLGGTCVNAGCIPTKALVASARAAHVARRASDFGVEIAGDIRVDMPSVKARMKRIAGDSHQGVSKWIDGMEGVELIQGHARFVSPSQVEVAGQLLEAERIFLNVGARPFVPDMPGVEEVDFLTSSGILELDELPEHLIVIGGSYIGLEFGQVYRRFGSRVSVIERGDRLIKRDDPDVSAAVQAFLEKEGIDIYCNAECLSLEKRDGRIGVRVECEEAAAPRAAPGAAPGEAGDGSDAIDDEGFVAGSHILLAVGRVPNTHDLGLDAAGVITDARGFVQVDEQLRTNVPGIWALGDCNGKGAFTHTSYNDFEIVAANLLDNDPRRLSDRILCYGLFTDPPLGRVGMTEAQARASGRNVLVGKRPMSRVGRAKERSETDGFIKILVDGDSHEILGAAILGIEGDEVVHSLLDVMYAKRPYTTISRAMHIHPTVSELVPTTLQDLRPL